MSDPFSTPVADPFMSQASGPPVLGFPNIGDTHSGVITKVETQIDTKPDGTVKTWDSGQPMQVFVFYLDDNGEEHRLFVRGNMVTVIREAAKAAGLPTVVGSKLTIRHHALGEAKKGKNPAKLYQAKLEPAPARVDTSSPF